MKICPEVFGQAGNFCMKGKFFFAFLVFISGWFPNCTKPFTLDWLVEEADRALSGRSITTAKPAIMTPVLVCSAYPLSDAASNARPKHQLSCVHFSMLPFLLVMTKIQPSRTELPLR